MKLFLITVILTDECYDCYDRKLVRAVDEQQARSIASKCHGDEGCSSWLDSRYSVAEVILVDGEASVIIDSFNAV